MGQTLSALAHESLLGFAAVIGAATGLGWGAVTGLGGITPARGQAGSSGMCAQVVAGRLSLEQFLELRARHSACYLL